MLENVQYLIRPEKEEEKTRLKAEQEKLAALQMKLKEHKVPVLDLFEGWGSAGKGTLIDFSRWQPLPHVPKKRKDIPSFTVILPPFRKPENSVS